MSRPRKREEVSVGGKFEPALATAFLNLARAQGVSMREALRRVMTQAVIDGKVPGINLVDLEQHEREKWGEATPTYDGEERGDPKTPQKASKASIPPVELDAP